MYAADDSSAEQARNEGKRTNYSTQTTAMSVILLVEDDADIRDAMRLVLALEGYDVATATNGEEALARVAKQRPDLVISDVMMPVLNGFELCRRLRTDPATRDIPIILNSSFVDPGEPLEQRWDTFMRKPAEISTLLREIERLLRRK